MRSRRKAREFALQVLYATEVGKGSLLNALESINEAGKFESDDRVYGTRLVEKSLGNSTAIDDAIRPCLQNWDIERLAVIDRVAMRLAVTEMMFISDVPINVCINEAVDLVKKFSSKEASGFVNGVLDAVAQQLKNPELKNLAAKKSVEQDSDQADFEEEELDQEESYEEDTDQEESEDK